MGDEALLQQGVETETSEKIWGTGKAMPLQKLLGKSPSTGYHNEICLLLSSECVCGVNFLLRICNNIPS